MKFPDKYLHAHPFIPVNRFGGYFKIDHNVYPGYFFRCIATTGNEWDHVAVTVTQTGKRPNRCPTWDEMCFIKSIFWKDEEPVMQLHPAKSEWISNHPYCLHLWKPKQIEIPLPPSCMVGIKRRNVHLPFFTRLMSHVYSK